MSYNSRCPQMYEMHFESPSTHHGNRVLIELTLDFMSPKSSLLILLLSLFYQQGVSDCMDFLVFFSFFPPRIILRKL